MSVNLYIFYILLRTVLLSAIEQEASILSPGANTTDLLPAQPTDGSDPTTTAKTLPATSTTPATKNSTAKVSTETAQSAATNQTPDPDGEAQESGSGLTPGEVAGVAVGTIAGVAALGGGIFAGLKISGKLG